ncbi:MAG: M20/M25/M40 family metallo-hydrolase [Oscillospiraceae bacterium]|nr:M20/M25/M40 family metallo-hydrolase [Oscillospiraceae bacterium]
MMIDRIDNLSRELCTTPGLAGHEQKVCEIVKREFLSCNLEPVTDNTGNCYVKIEGTDPKAPVLMITAHMDSLGFVVRFIEEDGFLRVERVGGIPEKVLPATEMVVGSRKGGYYPAVIGVKSHHQTEANEKYTVDPYKSLYVDLGVSSREEVEDLGIQIGSPVLYKPKYQKIEGSRVYASWLDDRGGVAVLLDLAHELVLHRRPSTIWLVATVLEEFNFGGAKVAAKTIKPDMSIAIDGGSPYDTPDLKGEGFTFMGKGPVMDLYNFHGRGTLNGTFAHPAMVRVCESAAEAAGIGLQRQAYVGGLTDVSNIQFEGSGGVMCLDLGFPIRYCHSPTELSDLKDMEALSLLIKQMADSLSAQTDLSR